MLPFSSIRMIAANSRPVIGSWSLPVARNAKAALAARTHPSLPMETAITPRACHRPADATGHQFDCPAFDIQPLDGRKPPKQIFVCRPCSRDLDAKLAAVFGDGIDLRAAIAPCRARSHDEQFTARFIYAEIRRCFQPGKGLRKMVVGAYQPPGAITDRN